MLLLTKGGRVQFQKQRLPESVGRMRRPADAFTLTSALNTDRSAKTTTHPWLFTSKWQHNIHLKSYTMNTTKLGDSVQEKVAKSENTEGNTK